MKAVQYGEFIISVDVERTKEYYKNYSVSQTQADRNFAKYCETLSTEEKDFFDTFGINPVCCKIEHIGVSKKGDFPCGGYFLVCGEYLAFPPENLITVEELAAKNFIDDRPDPRINIGSFRFDFQCPEYTFYIIPEDMPEGFICIRFWCENMKWLLDEVPENRMYEPPRFWEIRKIMQEKRTRIKQEKERLDKANREFCSTFDRLHIPYFILEQREVKKYRKAWTYSYTPPEVSRKRTAELCVYSHKYNSYLWQMFSLAEKDCCVFLDNINNLAYRLENADAVTPDLLKSFIDVTVTAADFSWTYSQTHEEECGPYFYRK